MTEKSRKQRFSRRDRPTHLGFPLWFPPTVASFLFLFLTRFLQNSIYMQKTCPPPPHHQHTQKPEDMVFLFQFSSVKSLSHVQFFATAWTAARQVSLSITSSWSLPKLMSIESVIPSNHLILCRPLLLLTSIFPSIRVFSNESALRIRWPKDWSFSFSISLSNEYSGLIFRMDWLDFLLIQGLARVFSNTTVQKHPFFSAQLSLQSNFHIHT